MPFKSGWLHGRVLDGSGGGRSLDSAQVGAWKPEDGTLWLHLDRSAPDARRWLREDSGLEELVCDALLAEETRPRCVVFPPGAVIILRGINLNPDTDPEDMVTLRLWAEPRRVISLERSRVRAVGDVQTMLSVGNGPCGSGEFVAEIAERLTERMEPFITDLEDEVDELEDAILDGDPSSLISRLTRVRRSIILLRRHIAPQRDALGHLSSLPWLDDEERRHIRETSDRVHHYVEELDSGRERALVIHDQIEHRIADRMTRTIYLLSLVSALFLPLTFVAGLMGMNVGGIPGANHSLGFWAVSGVLGGCATGIIMLYRRLKWL